MLGAGPLPNPRSKAALDFFVVGVRIGPTQVLAHQIDTRVDEVQRQTEGALGACRSHPSDCSAAIAWQRSRGWLP